MTMEFIWFEELLDLLQQNLIDAQVAIKKFQLPHLTPLRGWKRMWIPEGIGIQFAGINEKTVNREYLNLNLRLVINGVRP